MLSTFNETPRAASHLVFHEVVAIAAIQDILSQACSALCDSAEFMDFHPCLAGHYAPTYFAAQLLLLPAKKQEQTLDEVSSTPIQGKEDSSSVLW